MKRFHAGWKTAEEARRDLLEPRPTTRRGTRKDDDQVRELETRRLADQMAADYSGLA